MERSHSPDLDTQSPKVTSPIALISLFSLLVSKSKVILFGGATGDTGKYIITGDTYGLDLIGNKWAKLDGKCFISLNLTFFIKLIRESHPPRELHTAAAKWTHYRWWCTAELPEVSKSSAS